MSDVIAIRDVGHAYVPGRWVFRNYKADVGRGRILSLLGPNGRGKTTLLKVLLGIMPPTEGKIEVRGTTAFVPQLFQVSFDYSALDMVLMGRAKKIGLFAQPSKEDEEASLVALERFNIADLAGRSFHELSGGQRQMVILARALVAEAEILVLDEPTSALDLKNQSLILDWMARLSHDDGLTVVFTTHQPHHALAVADDVLLMLDQSEFAFGAAEDVLTEVNLHALYGIPLKRLSFDHDGRAFETLAPVFYPHAERRRSRHSSSNLGTR